MPDFTIRGNPGAIRSRAATTSDKGQVFYDTGEALAKVDTSGWTGRAADRFRDAHDLEPERWWKAGNGFRRAGAALTAYADQVEHAQGVAAWAKAEYARGERVTEDARSRYDADVADARAKLASGEYSSLTIDPFVDPGAAVRDNALAELATARRDLENAAHVCAGQVRAGCADAPEGPSWWESGLRFVGGIFAGAGEAVWDIVSMSPFSVVNLVQDGWKLANGDLTPEELATKYQLSLESAQQMLEALKDDPLEFGKNLGKGLLDWDTWADDPARAIGHLVPDALAAAFTGGGAAVATRGTKGGLDALDALSDMSKMDELTGLGTLDELGDLGRTYSMMDDLPHTTRMSPEQLGSSRYADDLPGGMSRREAIDLINKPVGQLSPAEVARVRALREMLPAPDDSTVMQKVIRPDQVDQYILGRDPEFDPTRVQGSVTRAEDTAHLTTPQQLHEGLRLDYDGTPFRADDDSMHLMRFTTPDPRFEAPLRSEVGGGGNYDGYTGPFTGNGFTKAADDIVPEFQTHPPSGGEGRSVPMRDGAEMWEVLPSGNQRLVAVLRDQEWIPQGN